ncbi:hypothetical protein OG874_21305 [Nocardia sp. NBC_00565]|uniref:hypothetical protein n=1 Tax=Nocardia sp. NBC_00565 TaxID=2975993 RepID=UPI002E7FD771|nr:hypothetical protein [Nocardia sp. NBC_00565]WUC07467.1 hypothetical protein OG874_21305 [Nocardia sp. NBC_00565]
MDEALDTVTDPLVAASMRQLVSEILLRYGSIDAFCARLHRLLDEPTDQIPAVTGIPCTYPHGRHRLRERESMECQAG